MSPAGTPMGSPHRDVPRPTSATPDDVQIDPATGEMRGGWKLPDDFDQRPQPDDDSETPAPETPDPAPEPVAPVAAPRPVRDRRLDRMTPLQRAGARPQLEHLDEVSD